MAVYPNNYRTGVGMLGPYTFFGITPYFQYNSELGAGAGSRLDVFIGDDGGGFPKTHSAPYGYGMKTPWAPIKAGGIASFDRAKVSISASANGTMGAPIDGDAAFSISFSPASGQLISSAIGSASMSFTLTGNVLATLSGVGTATMAFTTNTPLLGALGWVAATGAFSFTGSLVPYAKGFMVGTTVDTSTLTTAAILAAMNADPPKVNIAKVNDVVVTGTGAVGDEWGP